jgi:hypothetical protein
MQISPGNASSVVSSAIGGNVFVIATLTSPFRNSIWPSTDKYQFRSCTNEEFDAVAKIFGLWAAKLNIAFPSLDVCRKLATEAASVIELASTADQDRMITLLEQYLARTKLLPDVGITTAICLLAIWSDGRFAPIDRKVASGMRNLGILSANEEKTLGGNSFARIAHVYVMKVLPAWVKETKRLTPKEVDDHWGRHADKRNKARRIKR